MTTAPATASPSSFDVRPFGRMFWKEYRQQRTLWVGVLVSGICLQLIARIVISVTPFPQMPPSVAILFLYIIPLYLVPFFLIASTAMLFALEREERTSDWLLNLSAPPWPTLLAKSGSAIAGAVSQLLVMWLWAAVLSVGSGFEFKNSMNTGPSLVWATVGMLGTLSLVGAGLLLWGALGSLTSRRVVTAVPAAIVWWLAIYAVPITTYLYLYWLRYGTPALNGYPAREADRLHWYYVTACLLLTAGLNIHLGLRWCRGQYLDASWLEELNERLTAILPWNRGRSSRVPVAIESEHSGWRTWQRLVWQERHRESLHTGLLVIVCATSLLLALYSLADGDGGIMFAVIPLIVALPLVMGVLGFRFDAGGQQLRFLANRGTSPTMIWLAKHVVWLPRACWIPAVCWAVACLVEWAFIPWSGSRFEHRHSNDGLRHPLVGITLFQREHFFDVLWFVLMSYAVGQAAAMLFRRMILAVGAGLMATILLIYWQVLVVHASLPHWWAVGGIAVWLMCLTGWYSRHWLIERRSWPVVKRLAVGLALPPMLLLFGAALYRWLEIPGLGPSSPTLMALLYPRETERRESIMGSDISHELSSIRAAVKAVTEPTSPESRAVQYALVSVSRHYSPLSQIKATPQFLAGLPANASLEEQERAARERFWSLNEKPLAVIMEVLTDELPESYRSQRTGHPVEDATPNSELVHDAGRLSLDQGDPRQALRYFLAGLRLARCSASQNQFANWVWGREVQVEILQSLVLWSNHEDVTREMLIEAIGQTQVELARYPTLREASAAEFVLGFQSEKWLRLQMESEESASLSFAKSVAAALVPHEFARQRRINEQVLFWRWHLFHSLEAQTRSPGSNPRQQLVAWEEGIRRSDRSDNEWMYSIRSTYHPSRFGHDVDGIFTSYEAVNRQALLALAIGLWKKDHDGALPDSLEDLAAYCIINGQQEPARVLPIMALNDPWTGGVFVYSRLWAKSNWIKDGSKPFDPITIIRSAGSTLHRDAAMSVQSGKSAIPDMADAPDMIVYTPDYSRSSSIQLQKHTGRLSLMIPPTGRR